MRPIVVSTSGVSTSDLVRFDDWALADISVQVVVTGTVTYTVQISMDDPNSPTNPVPLASMTWTTLVASGSATTGPTAFTVRPIFARVNQTAGTGSTSATFLQGGVVPY